MLWFEVSLKPRTSVVGSERAPADGAVALETVVVRRDDLVQDRVPAESCQQPAVTKYKDRCPS